MFLIELSLKICVIKPLINAIFCLLSQSISHSRNVSVTQKTVSVDRFQLKYCHDRWKTENMCDESVDDSLAVLTFVVNWNVTSTIL